MTEELKKKLLSACDGYDSDETIIYNPGGVIIPKSPKQSMEYGTATTKASKCKIRGYPSKSGFSISIHGIRCK